MKKGSTKPVRCAIYTRVSTDHGLEQDFNSLDAQHDAAQAYIRSQAHAGWTLIRSRYDDGGYSGGSTERPALQRLLADVRAAQGRRHRGLQGRPADPIVGRLRQAGGAVRRPWGVVRLGHPAVQYHDLDGAADPECAVVVCPVRAGGHLRAHPRQDCRLQAQGALGRRHRSPRIRDQGPQDRRG